MRVHGDEEDPGHQDQEEEDLPHPSARYAAYHPRQSAKQINCNSLLFSRDGFFRVSSYVLLIIINEEVDRYVVFQVTGK